MTMVIMVVVFVISIILWGVDSSLLWLVGKLTSLK
jgi:preprotein translocase subunit SecE